MRRRKRKTKAQLRGRKPRRLAVQPLEERRLMAADIGLSDGWIHVDGSDQADLVETYYDGGQIVVSATARDAAGLVIDKADATFEAAGVRGVFFEGHAGNDVFVNDTELPVVARGGAGNDTLLGNASTDVLAGGDGDDFLAAGAAGAVLFGGAGENVLFEVEPEAIAEPLTPPDEMPTGDAESESADEGICLDTPEWAAAELSGGDDAGLESESAGDPSAEDAVDASDSIAEDATSDTAETTIDETNEEPADEPADSTVVGEVAQDDDDAADESNVEVSADLDESGDVMSDSAAESLVPIGVADELPTESPGDEATAEDPGDGSDTTDTVDPLCADPIDGQPAEDGDDEEGAAPTESDTSDPLVGAELTGSAGDTGNESGSEDNAEEFEDAELVSSDVNPDPPSDNDFIVGGWGDDQIFGGDGDDWLVGYQLDDAALSEVLFGVLDALARPSA